MSSYADRHRDYGGRHGDPQSYEKRRPSVIERAEHMPQIREGEREYSRSKSISIPSAKSQPRHEYSSYTDRDSGYGSIHSTLSRTSSNTSSGRRESFSSHISSTPDQYDDDKSGIDGMFGFRGDSYNASVASSRRPSLIERSSGSKLDRAESYDGNQDANRHRQKDIDGSYGWDHQPRNSGKPDFDNPSGRRLSYNDHHRDRRHQDIDSRDYRRR